MNITLTGNLGSGKTNICNILEKEVGFEIIKSGELFREIANERKISVVELNELAKSDKSIDTMLDERSKVLGDIKTDSVFDSRMGWFFVSDSFKVFLLVEIKEAAKTIDAGESNPLTEEILSLIPENKEPLDTPTQVTSEQIKELTPTMTREDVLSLLGDTQDVGSGIYIYLYEVDQQYLLRIPFASDEAQLGVTGEDLLKALVPISGDIAPMVYVNDTLYQIVDSQPNFADEKSSFNLLGKIENTVSSSEEPKENFQANDDIVGAAVYQYGDNIVVEFEGKYWLYEHYHNTDFDGNSD